MNKGIQESWLIEDELDLCFSIHTKISTPNSIPQFLLHLQLKSLEMFISKNNIFEEEIEYNLKISS